MYFSNNRTKAELFHVMCGAVGSASPTEQYTKNHRTPGEQIAHTVGHGAPGTFELMKYHLLYGKFRAIERRSAVSQWRDDVTSGQNCLHPLVNKSPDTPIR